MVAGSPLLPAGLGKHCSAYSGLPRWVCVCAQLMMTFCVPLLLLLWVLGRGGDFKLPLREGRSVELSGLISHPSSLPVKVTVPALLLWQTFKKSILFVSENLDLFCFAISHSSQG